jgi:hypothetical protein
MKGSTTGNKVDTQVEVIHQGTLPKWRPNQPEDQVHSFEVVLHSLRTSASLASFLQVKTTGI